VKDAPLTTVLEELRHQSALPIVYTEQMLAPAHRVTIELTNVPLERALDLLLKDQPLTWSILEGTVVLRPKPDAVAPVLPPAAGPNNDIHGRVTDSLGNPLAGASVTVKGSRVGTSTDTKGNFELRNVEDNATIIISYSGFEAREFRLSNNRELKSGGLSVVLQHNNSSLDQVQIIAYGQTTQRLSTSDITTISSKQLEDHPVSNPLAALEGMVPGLFITQNTGMPGGAFTVQIRGQNSIQNGNDPFYVIDGVPYVSELLTNENPGGGGNPLNFLNLSDIESISVLKDADATAIYGSRAANGAILITTKKGKAGKMRVDINAYNGEGSAPLKVHWLNTPQYLAMREEAFKNDGQIPDQYSAPDLIVWDTTRYTNWQKKLIGGTANYNDVQASISGGDANTQYLFGIGYHSESSVFPLTGSDGKISGHMSLATTSPDQRFKANITANYLYDKTDLPANDLTQLIASTPPDAPAPFDSVGNLNWQNNTWTVGAGNPLAIAEQHYEAHTDNLISNAVISYRLLKGLDIMSSFGYTNMETGEMATSPIASQNPVYAPLGRASYTANGILSWIIEPQANYVVRAGLSKFGLLAGSTFEQNTSNGQILLASGYTSDALIENVQAAPYLQVLSLINDVYKYNALFGRVSYNYNDKYLINLNLRRDGSSRFGPDRQFHDFGSAGAAWIFSKESFMKDLLPVLSFGKLSASYGTTGNDQIGDYGFYDLYSATSLSYQNIVGLNPQRLYNPNLAWEETKKQEGGIELGFLKDMILLNADYYRNRSSDQLVSYPVSAVTGFTSISLNIPAVVQNDGIEMSLNLNNLRSEHFSWSSSINLTIPHNKLISFPDLSNSSYSTSYIIGQPLSVVQAYHMTGVDPATGVYQFSSKGDPFNPSYFTDRTAVINVNPKYYGGFRNTFKVYGFQLDILFQFLRQMGRNALFEAALPPGIAGNNASVGVLKRWQKPGDVAPIEAFTQNFASAATNGFFYAQQSDRAFSDASFIRLKNVSLSYELPVRTKAALRIVNCKVFMRGENLITITKYAGMDPENQSLSALPPLRVITAGIQLGL
jgi:TonB-linked SusC/RagA family outer membrane protein